MGRAMVRPAAIRTFLATAESYDRMVDWDARLRRELPFLLDALGPPGRLGILDAGCGTGRHAVALARRGYRVTAADVSRDMLALARRRAREAGVRVRPVRATFDQIHRRIRRAFDGVFCVGNSLALAGSPDAARSALAAFAGLLRPGGRLLVQVINFEQVREQASRGGYVRGPQSVVIDGREFVSCKVFQPTGRRVVLTGITLWKEDGRWQREVVQGTQCPIDAKPLSRWLKAAGFRVLSALGSYAGEPYDAKTSGDLIVVAERK